MVLSSHKRKPFSPSPLLTIQTTGMFTTAYSLSQRESLEIQPLTTWFPSLISPPLTHMGFILFYFILPFPNNLWYPILSIQFYADIQHLPSQMSLPMLIFVPHISRKRLDVCLVYWYLINLKQPEAVPWANPSRLYRSADRCHLGIL